MIDQATLQKLKAPFPASAIDVKPGATTERDSQKSGLVLTFIDARAVQERLDEAFGGEWDFTWEPMPEYGNKLAVKGIIRAAGIERQDVGQANGEEEPYKSAVSDAMKRAAVHFGIGRYLYALPQIWWPMDGKRFKDHERLVRLMGELSQELHDTGGDLTKIDMHRYRYSAGNQQQAKTRSPQLATHEQIEQLKQLIAPRLLTVPEKRDFFLSTIRAYPQKLEGELSKDEAQALIDAANDLPLRIQEAA